MDNFKEISTNSFMTNIGKRKKEKKENYIYTQTTKNLPATEIFTLLQRTPNTFQT